MSEQAMDRIQRQLQDARDRKAAAASVSAAASKVPAQPVKRELSEAVKAGMAAGNINITSTG